MGAFAGFALVRHDDPRNTLSGSEVCDSLHSVVRFRVISWIVPSGREQQPNQSGVNLILPSKSIV
ncbi:MAG: hypothetical protein QOH71_490 [Blastocatellia bacterium]|jgi:hypothetical protein|nr:hypothetical protein [Blastocatellia bacterium]